MIRYEKYHGAGNDFLIVDGDAPVPDRRRFAVAACDRESETGVGADGVLFLDPIDANPPRVQMHLYQPDGSTAAMCGNGARCAAAWAARRTGVDEIVLETPAGIRRTTVDGDEVTVEMGTPSFAPEDVPLADDRETPLLRERVAGLKVSAVDTGVPHAVCFVEDVDAVDLERVAPPIRHADVFPEGANVTVAAGGEGFDQRTFERGVEGETRACGTGAVAILAVARRLGITGETEATVSPPGGDLVVTVDGEATLRGPVVREGGGELPAALGAR